MRPMRPERPSLPLFGAAAARLILMLLLAGDASLAPPSPSGLRLPLAACAPDSDLVPALLPGADGALPSRLYSGFLQVDGGDHRVHYMLSESERGGDGDPLVLWFNGGPGSSSLIGFFQEFGPVIIANASSVVRNPFTWSRAANVLFFESPTGVGFSSCAASRAGGQCVHDDDSTASLNYKALRKFLELFPEYTRRKFMIWGESYAGVYIPMLAKLLHDNPLQLDFLGFAVGDPCTAEKFQHLDDQLHFNMDYALHRGFISSKIHAFITANCTAHKHGIGHVVPDYSAPGCRAAWRLYFMATSNDDHGQPESYLPHGGFVDPYTCYGPNSHDYDQMLHDYLSTPAVQDALHVSGLVWGDRRLKYTKQHQACYYEEDVDPYERPKYNTSMLPIYAELAGRLPRIVVFNGDTDPDVQFQGTEDAISALGLEVEQGGDWRPWFYRQHPVALELLAARSPFWGGPLTHHPLPGSILGGYTTNYEGNVSFITVHNSGHLVPMFQPQAAFHLFYKALHGLPLSPPIDVAALKNLPDDGFFGRGYMKQWVELAQAPFYSESVGSNAPLIEPTSSGNVGTS